MPTTIAPTRQPLDATQQGSLRKLFDSPAFSLLKEVVVARCIEQQLEAMKALVYPNNEAAKVALFGAVAEASALNALLDLLDDLDKQEQEWFTVKLEPRR